MSDEAAFLNAILANPEDNAPRLIYADWLEERGDPAADAKAGYLRDVAIVLAGRGRDRQVRRRLERAARDLDGDWIAIVGKVAIEACAPRFRFLCPKQWEKLTATADVRVRDCSECGKKVYYCDSIAEASNRAWQGQCVALNPGVPRRPDDLMSHPREVIVGDFEPEPTARELIEEFEEDRRAE